MKSILIFLTLFGIMQLNAQSRLEAFLTPSPTYNPGRAHTVYAAEGIITAATLFGLDYLWYKHYERSSFHFYNDNHEWLQMDKLGHATTAYTIGVLGTAVYRWAGMNNRQANWLGGTEGLAYLTVIEVLDGFSAKWGFSKGDMLANLSGSALCIGQQFLWNEQKIQLKFAYMPSQYAHYRPDELGNNFIQRLLKDYNGQTYWLSFNLHAISQQNNNLPVWLNGAIGYGAGGMLGGDSNPSEYKGVKLPTYERYRRIMLSPDLDFIKIPYSSSLTSAGLTAINLLKCPAPLFELRLKEHTQARLKFY